jgi:hypothetical protein
MLDPLAPYIGGIAAFLASLSHVPTGPQGVASRLDGRSFSLHACHADSRSWALDHLRLNTWRLDDRGRERGKAPRSRPSFSAVNSAILNRAVAEASSAAEEC